MIRPKHLSSLKDAWFGEVVNVFLRTHKNDVKPIYFFSGYIELYNFYYKYARNEECVCVLHICGLLLTVARGSGAVRQEFVRRLPAAYFESGACNFVFLR
jgi:hypothetical protein